MHLTPTNLGRLLVGIAVAMGAGALIPSGASAAVSLAAPQPYPVNFGASHQQSLAVGDLTGDARPEIAVGARPEFDTEQAFFSLLTNNGSGLFGTATKHGIGSGEGIDGITIGHVLGNSPADVAMTSMNGVPTIFQGDGAGAFPASTGRDSQGTGGEPAIAKLNGDAYPDLAIANGGPATIAVFRGGTGGGLADDPRIFDSGTNAGTLIAADVNRDKRQDLIAGGLGASGGSAGTLSLLLGKRGGRFEAPNIKTWGSGHVNAVAANISGDRRLEVIAAAPGDTYVSVFSLNRSDKLGKRTKVSMPAGVGAPAIADLDGNGRLDLVASLADERIAVRSRKRRGGFSPAKTFAAGGPVGLIRLADLDGDGDRDVVGLGGTSVRVLLNDG